MITIKNKMAVVEFHRLLCILGFFFASFPVALPLCSSLAPGSEDSIQCMYIPAHVHVCFVRNVFAMGLPQVNIYLWQSHSRNITAHKYLWQTSTFV